MISAAWCDQVSLPPFLYTERVQGSDIPSLPPFPAPSRCRAQAGSRKALTQAATRARECFWGTPGIFLTADSKPAGSKGYESSLYQGCAAPKQPLTLTARPAGVGPPRHLFWGDGGGQKALGGGAPLSCRLAGAPQHPELQTGSGETSQGLETPEQGLKVGKRTHAFAAGRLLHQGFDEAFN